MLWLTVSQARGGSDIKRRMRTISHPRIQGITRAPGHSSPSLSEGPQPFMFQPLGEGSRATLVVSVEGDPRALLGPVRRAVQALDPNVVPIDLETMKQYMALPLFPAHTAGLLPGAFGILALVLAVTALYGVISYAVGQRTHEIGVRLALERIAETF
jgi:hypothetical protein